MNGNDNHDGFIKDQDPLMIDFLSGFFNQGAQQPVVYTTKKEADAFANHVFTLPESEVSRSCFLG